MQLVQEQIRGIEKRQSEQVAAMESDQMRKVAMLMMLNGIVAVARRLLIDLWRLLEQGIIPEGARYNPELMKLVKN